MGRGVATVRCGDGVALQPCRRVSSLLLRCALLVPARVLSVTTAAALLRSRSQEPLLALYRARVLAWHGVHPTLAPSRHTILLVRKEGKRSIANFGAVETFVKQRYGQQVMMPPSYTCSHWPAPYDCGSGFQRTGQHQIRVGSRSTPHRITPTLPARHTLKLTPSSY